MHPGRSHLEVEDAHAGELEMMPRADSGDVLDAQHLQARQTKVPSSLQGLGFIFFGFRVQGLGLGAWGSVKLQP